MTRGVPFPVSDFSVGLGPQWRVELHQAGEPVFEEDAFRVDLVQNSFFGACALLVEPMSWM